MSDSVEYRDGVFVATGEHPVERNDNLPVVATGTALMTRPDGTMAPVEAPGVMVGAAIPPVAPPRATTTTGGARRIAVATIAAALVAAVAFGAAAFGGAFGSGTPAPGSARGALGAAAANSAGASSVAFTVDATRTTPSSTTTLVDGSGAVDLKTDVGRLSATVPSLAGMVGSGKDSVDVIADGSAIYLGSPALSSLTGGNTWLKADLPKDSGNADSKTLAVLANPSQLLGLLSSIGGQVTTVGNVDLHGTPTTEYSTTVTVAELAARAGLPTGSTAGADLSKVLSQLGNTSIPVKAWVGSDGYVRQLSASIQLSRATIGSLAGDLVSGALTGSLPTSSSGQSTTATTVTVGFSDYGAPVTVTVPPADQTTDVNGILSSLHGMVSDVSHAVSSFASHF